MEIIKNKGISLIEVLIIIAIIGILIAITIPNLSDFRKKQALKNTTEDIVSLLNEARNSTISSKNSMVYGVHFESDKAILFSGGSFVDDPSNRQIDFDNSVDIPTSGGINIGGGNDVVFTRIKGDTLNHGTIVVEIVSDVSKQNVINISQTGIVSVN